MSRRAVLAALPGFVLPTPLVAAEVAQTPSVSGLFISGGADAGLNHHVAAIDENGRAVFVEPLPGRGHAAAVSPDRSVAVMCARRAGRFATVVDLSTLTVAHQIDAEPDRHFYGHGAFSSDGRFLYLTENAYDRGDGRIGIYDATNGFRRLGEWPSQGVGPHELILHPDSRTLVVANGGILTHPDSGRQPLNLDTMAPNLAFIDTADGTPIGRIDMPDTLRLLSGRHLTTGREGTIALVMQYQGEDHDTPPLVAISRYGAPLSFLSAPGPIQTGMANYCGSVAFDRSGTVFGVSSPRGNLFTFWNCDAGFLTSVAVADGCGIAPDRSSGSFVLSSGTGGLWRFDIEGARLTRLNAPTAPIAHWDNHLTAI